MIQYKKTILLLTLAFFILNVGNTQVTNGSFEIWADSLPPMSNGVVFIDSAIQTIPLGWVDGSGVNTGTIGYHRTTDAADGEYAVVLNTWYVYVMTVLSKTDFIEVRPDFVKGKYKYLLKDDFADSSDVAIVEILIFNSQGETIGNGKGYLDTVSTYTTFNIPVDYINNDEGNSYQLSFTSSSENCSSLAGSCKYLFLDAITFDYFTNIEASPIERNLTVFPNPTNGEVNFSSRVKYCELYDPRGVLLNNYRNTDAIVIPDIPGLYFIKIKAYDGKTSVHKIIKM